jgi:endonuclease YncB( thermonuclease family)
MALLDGRGCPGQGLYHGTAPCDSLPQRFYCRSRCRLPMSLITGKKFPFAGFSEGSCLSRTNPYPRRVILARPATPPRQRGGIVIVAAAALAAGLMIGALIGPPVAVSAISTAPPPPPAAPDAAPPLRAGHPAQVVRVIDGDTFEARVGVWPGLEITTKVRLRGIDAPELRARCGDEIAKAQAARDALAAILAEGAVAVSQVALDKYGGRVIADASTRRTADVSAALLRAGVVRSYAGGRRDGWC